MKTASGLTIAIRKGDQNVHSLAQEDSHENESIALPAERIIADGPWTATQQRLLEVPERKEYRFASITQICQAAGYSGNMAWYQAMKDSRFATVVQALGVLSWSRPKRRLLEVLQHPENRSKSGLQICRLAGYKDHVAWNRAVKDERFVAELEALGVTRRRRSVRASHLEVTSATNIEEELKKDVWDVRRLKHDYPKHVPPSTYVVDFTWIVNPLLREQVKRYYRQSATLLCQSTTLFCESATLFLMNNNIQEILPPTRL
jgi:hypothetical protein